VGDHRYRCNRGSSDPDRSGAESEKALNDLQ
jgi:hypothetical protein